MLTIRDLSKTYANGVRALDGVSLDVPRGMFGLLGPNGAGKSSLMRTLATLQEADGGSVTLEGGGGAVIDVLRDKDAVRRQLGYLPQDFGVYPKVSALDLLEHFAGIAHVGFGIHIRREGADHVGEHAQLACLLLQRHARDERFDPRVGGELGRH